MPACTQDSGWPVKVETARWKWQYQRYLGFSLSRVSQTHINPPDKELIAQQEQ